MTMPNASRELMRAVQIGGNVAVPISSKGALLTKPRLMLPNVGRKTPRVSERPRNISTRSTQSISLRLVRHDGRRERAEELKVPDISRLAEELQRHFAAKDASLSDVSRILRALSPWLLSLSPEERAEKATRYQIGSRTLDWVWQREIHLTGEFFVNHEFIDTLCKSLVVERADRYIEHWLSLDDASFPQQAFGNRDAGTQAMILRGKLWRGIIAAELELRRPNADSAVKRFFQIDAARKRGWFRSELHSLSPYPALLALSSALGTARYGSTSASCYDKIIKYIKSFKGRDHMEQWAARLYLYHPTAPDPTPALTYLRRVHEREGGSLIQNMQLRSLKACSLVKMFIQETAELLRKQGRETDAICVEEYLKRFAIQVSQAQHTLETGSYALSAKVAQRNEWKIRP